MGNLGRTPRDSSGDIRKYWRLRPQYGWATLIVPKGGGLSGYNKASGGLIKPL